MFSLPVLLGQAVSRLFSASPLHNHGAATANLPDDCSPEHDITILYQGTIWDKRYDHARAHIVISSGKEDARAAFPDASQLGDLLKRFENCAEGQQDKNRTCLHRAAWDVQALDSQVHKQRASGIHFSGPH